MNVAFDGMAVASFQQVVVDIFADANAHNNDWNFETLLRLKGRVLGHLGREMFAIRGDERDKYRLIVLLTRSLYMQASNCRDRLYALMHLAEDYEENGITVDYNKTEENVMADAAAYHISQHQNLDFLISSFQDIENTYPSWIPGSWMAGNSKGIAFHLRNDHELRHTKCSLNSVDTRNLRLRIRGVRVGLVQQCFVSRSTMASETVADFWASSLGGYIQPYLEGISASLPLEISRSIDPGMYRERNDHESIQTGLLHLWEIGTTQEHASRVLGYGGESISDLLAPLKNGDQPAWTALRAVLQTLEGRSCIVTNNKHFGLIPTCCIQEEDEIWLVLGCPFPVVVRLQPGGSYKYICPARIPAFEEHTNIASLVSEIQPGDRIGEWTVEDIELE